MGTTFLSGSAFSETRSTHFMCLVPVFKFSTLVYIVDRALARTCHACHFESFYTILAHFGPFWTGTHSKMMCNFKILTKALIVEYANKREQLSLTSNYSSFILVCTSCCVIFTNPTRFDRSVHPEQRYSYSPFAYHKTVTTMHSCH